MEVLPTVPCEVARARPQHAQDYEILCTRNVIASCR